MTSDIFDLTNILLLAVAVAVFLRLRSVLGRRTEDDEARLDHYAREAAARDTRERDNVVPLPRNNLPPSPASVSPSVDDRLKAVPVGHVRDQLRDIALADGSFDASSFLNGAKIAYEAIVTAYAKGDRATLEQLLSRDVYDSFNTVIADRESRHETVDFSFVGIGETEIVDAHLSGRIAHITVRFVSDLVSDNRDPNGTVVEGDDKAVRRVTDIWTFSRDVASPNPNWQLFATDAQEV